MITRIPDYFHDFRCLAGACPDTCCGQWEIVVDEAAKARYLSVEGELGEKIRNAMTVMDGEDCMALEDGKCPLLDENGLCPIVSQLGEEFLSTTCHTHPRFTEIYGGLQETMLSISCPEAARLLLTKQEKLTFSIEMDSILPEPDDLDADEFDLLLDARHIAFALVQDRSRPLSDRLALLLCFAKRLQDNLEELHICQALCRRYENRAYQDNVLRRIRRKRHGGSMTRARQLYLSMEHLSEQFPKVLQDLERTDLTGDEIPLEQLTVYFLFRWWLKAACNDRIWQQAAAAVLSVLTVAGLKKPVGSLTEAARLYSKEVEHSEENLVLLKQASELPMFSLPELLKLLEVHHAI
ncbi:MAG: flagellin lysine-N-methylase [Oscillospiraceae bacterium]|nr:flagellin lysine-N-methylase [Oscillospiraceae bacterium]